MTTRFYYEDGQGRMVDEQGNDAMDWDAMDWDEEVTPFHLKTLRRIREYCEKQESGQISVDEDPKNFDIDMEDVITTVKNQKRVIINTLMSKSFYLCIITESSCSMQLNPGVSQAV